MSKASAYFTVSNINGKHDIKELKREIDTLHGVLSISVNDEATNVAVDFDTTGVKQNQIGKKIKDLGYTITDISLENHIM